MNVVLTLLYAPADRGDRAAKALASQADVVILDLEDAVAPAGKESARAAVTGLVAGHADRAVQVRVNSAASPWGAADLAMVADLPGHIEVRVPKVSSAEEAAGVVGAMGARPVHVLIESARGVEAAGEIARAGVATIGLGEADLRSDLGVSDEAGLGWCRQRVVVAARAAGLPAPAMAVYPNVADLEGLSGSTELGRRLGFLGRAAIHPRQLPVIEAAFAPGDDEVAHARQVLAAMEGAHALGDGTVVLDDGGFVDVAMVEQARRVLALATRPATSK